MITVLWIDDQPNDSFMDEAFDKYDIEIFNHTNVDDGIKELIAPTDSRVYDAIILDANCRRHNDEEEPRVVTLNYAFSELNKNGITIPWFVYSGGGFEGEAMIDHFVDSQERSYDKKNWYHKPTERVDMYESIKEVVSHSDIYKLKEQYSDIFQFYPNKNELVKILKFLEKEKNNDPDVYNLIRKELEWIMDYCYDSGLLLDKLGNKQTDSEKKNGLNNCSCLLSKHPSVPIYIQRSFHSTVQISNDGSHRLEIDTLVKSGEAPYLNKSTILELLNIIRWVKTLPQDEEGRKKLREVTTQSLNRLLPPDDYNGKEMVVEQDEDGNFHCGECLLSYKSAQWNKGKIVILSDVDNNEKSTKDKYPYFAQFTPKV